MTRKPRVTFLINSLIGGGAERVMTTLLAHSQAERADFDVSLALFDIVDRAYEPPDGLRTRQFDCKGSMIRSQYAVHALRQEEKPDLILSFLERSNFCNVLTAGKGPSIISERVSTRAHFTPGLRGIVSKSLVRTLYPRATRVIAVSQGIADELRTGFKVPAERLVAIANPVDLDAIRGKASEAPSLAIEGPYVLSAGRLMPNKNFALLIDAFAAAKLGGKLVILGQGPEREALIARAAALGIAGRVVFPGFEKNPFALMKRAQMFVLPSNAEGFPNSLVEAMATGAPVIAANCATGPSEILAEKRLEEVTGLTFAPHGILTPTNDVEAMSAALKAMSAEAMRRDYAAKAALRAHAYGAAIAKDRYWDVIRTVLAEHGL